MIDFCIYCHQSVSKKEYANYCQPCGLVYHSTGYPHHSLSIIVNQNEKLCIQPSYNTITWVRFDHKPVIIPLAWVFLSDVPNFIKKINSLLPFL